jgi:hypothetical protein
MMLIGADSGSELRGFTVSCLLRLVLVAVDSARLWHTHQRFRHKQTYNRTGAVNATEAVGNGSKTDTG